MTRIRDGKWFRVFASLLFPSRESRTFDAQAATSLHEPKVLVGSGQVSSTRNRELVTVPVQRSSREEERPEVRPANHPRLRLERPMTAVVAGDEGKVLRQG